MTPSELRDHYVRAAARGTADLGDELPVLAAEVLAAGYDSPLLCELAAMSASDECLDKWAAMPGVLVELGVPADPDPGALEIQLAQQYAADLLQARYGLAEVAGLVTARWDFDEVFSYPAYPRLVLDFAGLAWRHGFDREEYYLPAGGDDAFRAAAVALLAWRPGDRVELPESR